MNVKNIVKNVIKTLFIETGYGVCISIVSTFKKVLASVVEREAAQSEIMRLKGEAPLPLTEALMNYNNSLHLASNALIIMFVILAGYALYKCIVSIKNEIEASDASN